MEHIFHEKQEGALCAQHCLNALLQGSYFSAVDLADIAKQLDETEKQTMAEAGINTNEYRQFLNQESTNFDDSGFFSIQVLQKALTVWDLELVTYSSSADIAQQACKDPRTQKAYICNFKEHWFTIRKIGQQWFNLNSVLKSPDLVSDTYLHMYLLQLQQEGYSIFIVRGNLPDCEADQILQFVRVEAQRKPYQPSNAQASDLDEEMQAALLASRELAESSENQEALKQILQQSRKDAGLTEEDEEDFERAIQLSLQAESNDTATNKPGTSSQAKDVPTPSAEETRRKRLEYLDKLQGKPEENMHKDT